MKINYINVQGAILCGISNDKLEQLRKKVNISFENLDVDLIETTYTDKRNAIIALDKKKVIGWIDFEDDKDRQQIHNIVVLPEYQGEGIIDDLLEQAIYELKNDKPIIAIPASIGNYVQPIIEKYEWGYTSFGISSQEQCYRGYNEDTSCVNPPYEKTKKCRP